MFEKWVIEKLSTGHINSVTIAVANKLARYIWAVLTSGKPFYSPPLKIA